MPLPPPLPLPPDPFTDSLEPSPHDGLARAVADDVRAHLDAGDAPLPADARLACYQQALSLLLDLRNLLEPADATDAAADTPGPSLVASLIEREAEVVRQQRLLTRMRAALYRVSRDPGFPALSAESRDAVRVALQ